MSNGLQYAMSAWLPIVIFPQVEAPSFRKGYPATFACECYALDVSSFASNVLTCSHHHRSYTAGSGQIPRGQGET